MKALLSLFLSLTAFASIDKSNAAFGIPSIRANVLHSLEKCLEVNYNTNPSLQSNFNSDQAIIFAKMYCHEEVKSYIAFAYDEGFETKEKVAEVTREFILSSFDQIIKNSRKAEELDAKVEQAFEILK